MRVPKRRTREEQNEGEFLWLVSLSDLMILLFVFFVVLFSFSFKNMSASELIEAVAVLNGNPDTAIDDIEDKLKESLSQKGLADMVDVTQSRGTLTMDIKDAVLFDSGSYHLKDKSRALLSSMSRAFEDIPYQYHLEIEGHTDDSPYFATRSGLITDNWHLSLMRAYEVFENLGLSEELKERVKIVGYGPMKPLVPNRDSDGHPIPENRAKNRRVTIRIY